MEISSTQMNTSSAICLKRISLGRNTMTRTDVMFATTKAQDAIQKSNLHPDIKRGLSAYISETSEILDKVWCVAVDMEQAAYADLKKIKATPSEKKGDSNWFINTIDQLTAITRALYARSLYRAFKSPDYMTKLISEIETILK
jgi:hypothetical protein